jgi:hypothetical protein
MLLFIGMRPFKMGCRLFAFVLIVIRPDIRMNKDEFQTILKKQEVKTMFENLTVEQLKKERPDIFDSVFKLGLDEGVKKGGEYGQKQERERVVSILKKAKAFKDMNLGRFNIDCMLRGEITHSAIR